MFYIYRCNVLTVRLIVDCETWPTSIFAVSSNSESYYLICPVLFVEEILYFIVDVSLCWEQTVTLCWYRIAITKYR